MLPLYSAVLSSDGLFADLIDLRGLYGAGRLRLTVDRGSVRLSAGAAPEALDIIGDYSVGVAEVSIPLTRLVKVERLTGNSSTILVEILPHTADERNVTATFSAQGNVISIDGVGFVLPWSAQSAIPVILPSSGAVTAGGTITLNQALGKTYNKGAWMYLPASAIVGGAAGLYWVVMSSTTVGNVYTAYRNPSATSFIPAEPTETQVLATGSGVAYTQTTSEVTLVNITIPKTVLSKKAQIEINDEPVYITGGSAPLNTSKSITRKLGAQTLASTARTTTGSHDSITSMLRYKSDTTAEYYSNAHSSASSTAGYSSVTVDLTQDATLTWTGMLTDAANYVGLEAFKAVVWP